MLGSVISDMLGSLTIDIVGSVTSNMLGSVITDNIHNTCCGLSFAARARHAG